MVNSTSVKIPFLMCVNFWLKNSVSHSKRNLTPGWSRQKQKEKVFAKGNTIFSKGYFYPPKSKGPAIDLEVLFVMTCESKYFFSDNKFLLPQLKKFPGQHMKIKHKCLCRFRTMMSPYWISIQSK